MILYGLDPDAPGIRYLQASNRSIAEGQLGELKGDIVTFKPPCKISSLFRSRCKAVMEIEAPPDGQDIEIRIRETGQNGAGNPSTVIHYKFKLERLQPSQADEASGAR
jgi:hypothetical protein